MSLNVEPSKKDCGALVRGVDVSAPLDPDTLAELRRVWLQYKVIALPDQQLTPDSLTQFASQLGPASKDPYLGSLPDHPRVVEVRREPEEKTRIFADNFHSDWSFLPSPPSATILYGIDIPPVGGDTLYADLQAACAALPAERRAELSGLQAIHSARLGYATTGRYAKDDGRSMKIISDDSAMATQTHPLIRPHPETGIEALFVSPAYTIGIEGMADDDAKALLGELFRYLEEDRFIYRHKWQSGMLTIWDNRSVNHAATGGYEGHRRLLHRVTVGEPTVAA